MKQRLSRFLAACLLVGIGALLIFIQSIDGNIGKWMRERHAAERMQVVNQFQYLKPPEASIASAPAFGEGWSALTRKVDDNTCQNLDIEKAMKQMAAAEYPDLETMDTYTLCAELGFKPMLRRELEFPPLPKAVPPPPTE